MKTNNKNKVILWTLFTLLIVAGFGLGKVEKASAKVKCSWVEPVGGGEIGYRAQVGEFDTKEACLANCNEENDNTKCLPGDTIEEVSKPALDAQNGMNKDMTGDVCPGVIITSGIQSWFNCLLVYILRFIGLLMIAAATLFEKVIDTKVFDQILGKNAVIYEMWGFVRDILNIAFILALLFSAFCTVFQISKYSYKNMLVTIIIMALLVNFSFPIARVIIDFSNVIMYYFINGMGIANKGAGLFVEFSRDSAIGQIIYNTKPSADTSYLIAAIVFTFIFAVTLLMIAVLLLIRIVVLAILVIFASVAFVGSIVPFLSSQASKWWSALFNYCFFGPIMVFMLVVASKMMVAISSLRGSFDVAASTQSSADSSIIASMAFFMIPIVILWVGIGTAQSMSIASASAVVGRGQRFMSGVGSWIAGRPKWAAKQTGIPGGIKKRYDKSWLGDEASKKRQEKKEGWVYSKLGGKVDHEKEMKTKAEEYKKENESKSTLINKAKTGDAGAAYRLALDGNMDAATYKDVMSKVKDAKAKEEITKKTRDKNIDAVIQYRIDTEGARGTYANEHAISKEELDKLSPDKWKDQDINAILAEPAILDAAHDVYNAYNTKNKDKVTDNMHGAKYAAGSGFIW